MILQSLHDLAQRLADERAYGLAPPGHSIQKISFRVVLKPSGELFDFQDARQVDGGRLRPPQLAVPGSGKPPGSGINPCFLWDNGGYMLGYKPDDPKPERTRETFEAFRKRHLELEPELDLPEFSAVCRFLETWDPSTASRYPVLEEAGGGFGVFQILGETAYVHQHPRIVGWWLRQCRADPQAVSGQCLLTGGPGPIARLQPKIKGVSGGKAEALLVAFNESAYESYGKAQGYNAPVSEDAARSYGAALNALLDGPMSHRHRFGLGDATVAFWTSEPTATECLFTRFAQGGDAVVEEADAQDVALLDKMRAFLDALRQGREKYAELDEDPDGKRFFMLGLSPNAARLSVRFFHSGTLGELLDNLRRHFTDIGQNPRPAQGRRRADPEFPPVWMLLAQTARDRKEVPPLLAGPLLRAIIAGTPYPRGMFTAIIRRLRAGDPVNYAKACALKGFLNRNMNMEVSMSLDTERPDPAYRLGRLFAALEMTQRDALRQLNASIRDRFYSSASATPGAIFPRLLRTYQHHLAKLGPGHKVNREKLVQSIVSPLQGFPPHLSLAEQGLFAIGYYHQTEDLYTSRKTDAPE